MYPRGVVLRLPVSTHSEDSEVTVPQPAEHAVIDHGDERAHGEARLCLAWNRVEGEHLANLAETGGEACTRSAVRERGQRMSGCGR